MNMLIKTQTLLEQTRVPLRTIAQECEVSTRFLAYLKSGEYQKDPGVRKVQRIHDYLADQDGPAA